MDVLSRIGIGSATVDTVVPEVVTAGETVEGRIDIEGGSTDQEVDGIYLALETRYERDEGTRTAVVERYSLAESFTIEAGEERTETVELSIPRETPLTLGRAKVWFETGLDIDWALDPDDTDYVEVRPDEQMRRVLDGLEELGFELRSARPEAAPGGAFVGTPYVQELEFVPRSGPYRGDLDEVEVVFDPEPSALSVNVEVDRRGGLLAEMSDLDLDESYDGFTVGDEGQAAVTEKLQSVIDRNC